SSHAVAGSRRHVGHDEAVAGPPRSGSLVPLAEGNGNDFVRPSPERYDPELRQGSIIAAEHRVRYRWAAMAAEGRAVLDAGCGAGYGSAILADAGARSVTGLDIDRGAVAGAASSYGEPGRVEF